MLYKKTMAGASRERSHQKRDRFAQRGAAMSGRVYGLKHATPRMKYQHMTYVLDWRANLKQQQADFTPETCPLCGRDLTSRPLWMVGKFEMCFSCYEALEKQGNRPVATPKPAPSDNATDLACRALALIANGKATHETFRGLGLEAVAELVKKLEAQHFWLGKYADGSFIRYLAEKPLTSRCGRKFVGAVGPFLSPLGAAYYARHTGCPKIVTLKEAERLAREDNEGAWPLIREQLLVEMSMSPQEMNDFQGDIAAEYDPS
jgi:hypothetical protein